MSVTESASMQDHDLLALDPTRYSLEQLQRAARGQDPALGAQLAVALIARRGGDGVDAELGDLLRDEHAVRRARLIAVQELMRRGTPAAVRELRSAADVPTPELREAVLDGLTSLAGRGTHATGAWGRIDPAERPSPSELKTLRAPGGRRTVRVVSRSPNKREVEQAVAQLDLSEPVIRDAAMVLECAGQRFMFVPTVRDLRHPDRLLEAPRHIGYVAACNLEESGRWTARFAVLTYPNSQHDALVVDIVNRRGQSIYRGTASFGGRRIAFAFLAVDRPAAIAVDVAGALQNGRLSFTRAVSGTRRTRATEATELRR